MFTREELQHALDADELLLLYQAKVDMRTGKPVGVECAIRWRHPAQGLLHAMKFVNEVPPAGLAPDYMRFLVRTATRQMARWRTESVLFGRASINAWPIPNQRRSGLAQTAWRNYPTGSRWTFAAPGSRSS